VLRVSRVAWSIHGKDALWRLGLATVLVSLLYLTTPTVFEAEDYVKLHAINRAYLVTSVLSGRLPLWNPHVGLGRPFLADIETAAFYPPNLLYLVVEPHVALAILLVLHCALLLWGTARLGRLLGMDERTGLLVGVAYACSGVVVGVIHKGQIPFGEAIAWVPLAFLVGGRLQDAFEWRRLAYLALVLGLQVLCGHPQMAWLTWLGLALFLLGRTPLPSARTALRSLSAGLGGLALSVAWAAGLAAVALLPFFELVGQGNRSSPSLAFAAVGSLPWGQWMSLVLPAEPGAKIALGASFYVGPALALAGVAGLTRLGDRNLRGLAVVVAVGVVYGVGERTPVFALLYGLVPGLSGFRFPGRIGVIVTFALLLAAGAFLGETKARRTALVTVAAVGSTILVALVFWSAGHSAGVAIASRWVWTALAAAAVVLLILWHASLSRSPEAPPRLLAALTAVVAGELALTAAAHKPFFAGPGPFPAEAAVARGLAEAGLLREGAPPPRVLAPYPLIRDNSGMLLGYSNPSGYVALTLERVWIFLHESLGVPVPQEQNTFPSAEVYGFGPFAYPSASLVLGYDSRAQRLVLNPNPAPRAYLAHRTEVVADVHAAVARLRSGQDRDLVTLTAPSPALPLLSPVQGGPVSAEIRSFAAERLVVEAETATPAVLVLSEAWYPGWRAFVNGREAPCVPANAWMRAVAVPAGRSQVVLAYRSRYLLPGALVSLTSAGVLLGVLRRASRARRATRSDPQRSRVSTAIRPPVAAAKNGSQAVRNRSTLSMAAWSAVRPRPTT